MLKNPLLYFAEITDPRRQTKNKLHPLESIIFITLCAVLCGYEDWVNIQDFAEEEQEWFSQYIDLPHGIPSHDTLSDVMGRLNKVEFAQIFSRWVQDSLPNMQHEHIAIDGKTTGGGISNPNSITLVSAFASQVKMVLATTEVNKKTNEIKALPDLLKLIDINGSIVTADAIFCQKDICQQLMEKRADYVLSLKRNHETLYDDVSLFLEHGIENKSIEIKEENECDHGRVETRRYALSSCIDWLDQRPEWSGLKAIGRVESLRDIGGKQERHVRYYLSSITDLTKFSQVVRQHWSIENQQHWMLDVTFAEDASRSYLNNQRSNMALIRRISLNLLRLDIDKLSARRRKMKAALNAKYREKIIFQNQNT